MQKPFLARYYYILSGDFFKTTTWAPGRVARTREGRWNTIIANAMQIRIYIICIRSRKGEVSQLKLVSEQLYKSSVFA